MSDPPTPPVSLIAAGAHAIERGTSQGCFSKAEDLNCYFRMLIRPDKKGHEHQSIDLLVLSPRQWNQGSTSEHFQECRCENIPPARADYQQRAGSTRRRGNAVATVTAASESDSHDEHYFSRVQTK